MGRGVAAFLQKPYEAEQLRNAALEIIGGPERSRASPDDRP